MNTENIHKEIKDGQGREGTITLTSYDLDSATDKARAHEIDSALAGAFLWDKKRYQDLVNELDALCPKRLMVKHNLCVQAGRNVTAGILNGETTYTGIINYGLLGTASTALSDANTQLGTEVKRKPVATRTRVNDQVNFDFYYSKSDTNGTYQEFGMVIDGTASANTGQLFNRLLTGGWTKSSAEALTVSVQVNINAS